MRYLFFTFLFCAVLAAAPAEGQGQSGALPSGGMGGLSGDVGSALSEMDSALKTAGEEFSLEDDYYLGRAVAVEILSTYKLYTKDPAMVTYLNKICQAITVNSPRPLLFNGYHVEILDAQEINAFASPGGHIFLTKGLVDCADSEDALAAVIAHEVAHIQLRHAAAVIQNQRLVQDLSKSAGRAASIASRDLAPRERAVLFGEDVTVAVNALLKNGYARAQEFQADTEAVNLLRTAGYDPAALVAALRILEQIQPSRPGGFNNTHPSPAARMDSLTRISLSGRGRNTRSFRDSRFTPLK
jgi:predicted Zn-dependent protease